LKVNFHSLLESCAIIQMGMGSMDYHERVIMEEKQRKLRLEVAASLIGSSIRGYLARKKRDKQKMEKQAKADYNAVPDNLAEKQQQEKAERKADRKKEKLEAKKALKKVAKKEKKEKQKAESEPASPMVEMVDITPGSEPDLGPDVGTGAPDELPAPDEPEPPQELPAEDELAPPQEAAAEVDSDSSGIE